MSYSWIKFPIPLLDNPAVFQIAGLLNLDHDAVTGKLIRVLCAAHDHAPGGAFAAELSYIDAITKTPGFGQAMAEAFLLVYDNDAESIQLASSLYTPSGTVSRGR